LRSFRPATVETPSKWARDRLCRFRVTRSRARVRQISENPWSNKSGSDGTRAHALPPRSAYGADRSATSLTRFGSGGCESCCRNRADRVAQPDALDMAAFLQLRARKAEAGQREAAGRILALGALVASIMNRHSVSPMPNEPAPRTASGGRRAARIEAVLSRRTGSFARLRPSDRSRHRRR
jgi:hypothetical protein